MGGREERQECMGRGIPGKENRGRGEEEGGVREMTGEKRGVGGRNREVGMT